MRTTVRTVMATAPTTDALHVHVSHVLPIAQAIRESHVPIVPASTVRVVHQPVIQQVVISPVSVVAISHAKAINLVSVVVISPVKATSLVNSVVAISPVKVTSLVSVVAISHAKATNPVSVVAISLVKATSPVSVVAISHVKATSLANSVVDIIHVVAISREARATVRVVPSVPRAVTTIPMQNTVTRSASNTQRQMLIPTSLCA